MYVEAKNAIALSAVMMWETSCETVSFTFHCVFLSFAPDGEFDKIAAQRRVFKVETIGDW